MLGAVGAGELDSIADRAEEEVTAHARLQRGQSGFAWRLQPTALSWRSATTAMASTVQRLIPATSASSRWVVGRVKSAGT